MNPTRWQLPPTPTAAAALSSSPASGSSSNSHLRDDAQFIEFTPLPTNTARTPVAHEDSRLLASQPNSPSDRSQFQLAQQQALLSQAQHQQRPIRTASSASSAPSPLVPHRSASLTIRFHGPTLRPPPTPPLLLPDPRL